MSPAPAGRIDSIDLLRGVAVALVVLRHAAPEVFPGAGVVGVVMFFALSGHLITGLLLDEVARTGGSWAVCFVIGAASRVHADRLLAVRGPPPGAVVAAATSLGVLAVVPLRGHALTYLAGGPAIAMLTAVVLLAGRSWASVDHPALRPLVLLGTVSYAAYLWNYPLTVWLRPHTDLAGPLAVVLTLVCAALRWRYVEAPMQRRRSLVRAGR